MPPPQQVLIGLYDLIVHENFIFDIGVSIYRIVISFALACAVAVPLGILMGSFKRVEDFFNPLVSAWRYVPAPSFIPLLLMWFGTGDGQKLALLFIGVIWFLITLIMDHVKSVRTELLVTSVTLGGNRWQVLWTVVIPASLPNIFIAMRQMLAQLGEAYSLVLLDCPAGFSALSEAVIACADALLVPTIPSSLSMRTLLRLTQSLDKDVPALLPFVSMVDRRKALHRSLPQWTERHPELFLREQIPYASSVEQMSVRRAPVSIYDASDPAAKAFSPLRVPDRWGQYRYRTLQTFRGLQ